jgi:putative transposase
LFSYSAMRSRYKINDSHGTYFITSTIVEWLPIFTSAACCDIMVKALLHVRERKVLQIHAWVILDNHFHAILSGPDLSSTLRGLKGFTAQALIEQLRIERREWLLNQLAYYCASHKKMSEHQVWQEGVHPQAIDSDKVMEQKLDYLHDNPVKRGFVAGPEHWRYSSAHEWLVGASPLFICDPWR